MKFLNESICSHVVNYFFCHFAFWTGAIVAVSSLCPTITFQLGHFISNTAELRSWLPLRLLVSAAAVFSSNIWNWVEAGDKFLQPEGHPKNPLQNLNLLQDCLNNQVLNSTWTFSQPCSYFSNFSFFLQHSILPALIRYIWDCWEWYCHAIIIFLCYQ